MRRVILACAMFVAAGSAMAQNGMPPAEEQTPPGASSAPDPGRPAPEGGAGRTARAKACRKQQQAQGARGPELQDAVQLCVAQAHLDCLKQAIAAKTRGPERRAFIETCMSQAPN
jgi:hypothetical protein